VTRLRALRGERGQAMSEYLVVTGIVAAAILAGLALFTTPVALAFVGLIRRIVLTLGS